MATADALHHVVQLGLHVGHGLLDGGFESGVFDGAHALHWPGRGPRGPARPKISDRNAIFVLSVTIPRPPSRRRALITSTSRKCTQERMSSSSSGPMSCSLQKLFKRDGHACRRRRRRAESTKWRCRCRPPACVRMIAGVMAACGHHRAGQREVTGCRLASTAWTADPALHFPDFQSVGRRFGDLIASLRQQRVDVAQLRAGCGCHRLWEWTPLSIRTPRGKVPWFRGQPGCLEHDSIGGLEGAGCGRELEVRF